MDDADLCCAICIEVFKPPVLILDCGHNFCAECIRSAFERSRECPECRQPQTKVELKLQVKVLIKVI